jgi:DNA replication and repair protein RecF
MHLRSLTLRHFRNVGFSTLEFSGRRHFIAGANGQGKTSLLEAAGLLTALRSFRALDNRVLVGHGQTTAAITCHLEHERFGDTHVIIKLRHDGKELWCDRTRVTRLADHLGKFPTVIFSSQDLLLVRGAPAGRRRWLDLTLSAMDAAYLNALQRFTRALAGRNALLRTGRQADKELAAFEQVLAPAATELITLRAAGLQALAATLRTAYAQLCDSGEPADLAYDPDFEEPSVELLLARLEAGRERDARFRTTLLGPQRDDFHFTVRGTEARSFASEGQQRSLVLALRLAQAVWFQEKSGVCPVLLADDVLGELDPARRQRFWSAIDPQAQVIATGTSRPDAGLGEWQVFSVAGGEFTETTVRA